MDNSPLSGHLMNGESLVWQAEGAEKGLAKTVKIVQSAACVLFTAAFNVLFIATLKSPKVLIVGLPLLAAAVGFLMSNLKKHKTYYGITNMRIMKIRDGRFYADDLDNLMAAYILPGLYGRADVCLTFRNNSVFFGSVSYERDRGLNCLKTADAEYVCRLLQERINK